MSRRLITMSATAVLVISTLASVAPEATGATGGSVASAASMHRALPASPELSVASRLADRREVAAGTRA
ncbi:MAG TPA: hypothetical protein VH395_12380, partial [Jatrophihabitantaceae bacterium]